MRLLREQKARNEHVGVTILHMAQASSSMPILRVEIAPPTDDPHGAQEVLHSPAALAMLGSIHLYVPTSRRASASLGKCERSEEIPRKVYWRPGPISCLTRGPCALTILFWLRLA
ncbi:hypothetical protein CERZMDRAFT_80699 [Cercospora zeae-maydis SCOH1-5]|uniref:Uncharacterized protein n=1 Tax=Cercospora zeae-maydis SCOH1-5 TaxID=717836 RepID=A0A6A6FXF4_9PEZI|nr:hypothetical protein CERZMDRAFT_80699 [Cercospora zeae-maydis SCOH1-5]